jgi:integrative and conjugative element protein (TIGR02256 family)
LIDFDLGSSGQRLVFETGVLDHFAAHQQTEQTPNEAGGQLFAACEDGIIRVVLATGPRPTDKRGPLSYVPDRREERREIKRFFAKGLHFVGDWHTHPERVPSPSVIDIQNMQDCFRRSVHGLNFFVLVIVGDEPNALRVSVSLCNANVCIDLK